MGAPGRLDGRGLEGPGLAWLPAAAPVPDVCCPEEPGRSHCPNLTRPDPVGPAGPCEAPEVPRAKAQWPQPPGRLQPAARHPPPRTCRPLGTRDGAWGQGGCMWWDSRRFRAVSGDRQQKVPETQCEPPKRQLFHPQSIGERVQAGVSGEAAPREAWGHSGGLGRGVRGPRPRVWE